MAVASSRRRQRAAAFRRSAIGAADYPALAAPCNVDVRPDGTTGARDALLFRDFHRHDS